MEYLQELSSDALKHVVVKEMLMDPPRKKWNDAKRTKLEYTLQTSILDVWFYIRQEGILIVFNLISLLT